MVTGRRTAEAVSNVMTKNVNLWVQAGYVKVITGARMYSEYHSFRRGFLRWKTKKRSPE